MLVGTFTLLTVKELPAKDSFPPSLLVSVFDEESGSAITIFGREGARDDLLALPPLATVSLRLQWRAVDLRQLGGKGTAYRLQVTEVIKGQK